MASRPLTLPNAESLRDLLDALNEAGTDYRAVGMDARGEPFLIALCGPYAESEDVIYGSPWDGEIDWGTGRRCDECSAANLHGMDSLRFPVTLLVRNEPTPARDAAEGQR